MSLNDQKNTVSSKPAAVSPMAMVVSAAALSQTEMPTAATIAEMKQKAMTAVGQEKVARQKRIDESVAVISKRVQAVMKHIDCDASGQWHIGPHNGTSHEAHNHAWDQCPTVPDSQWTNDALSTYGNLLSTTHPQVKCRIEDLTRCDMNDNAFLQTCLIIHF
jgi:hypothetical protein